MSDKKYKILKNFTPRDLYEAQAPIELFLTCMRRREDIDLPFYQTQRNFVEYGQEIVGAILMSYEPWIPWLIENKFIEEYKEDIELKPGMILENTHNPQFKYVVTDKGLYMLSGFICSGELSDYQDVSTLSELNNALECPKLYRVMY